MRRLPPLNAVRAFEAAARHVSFTKAAQELGVTHGAVSRQVALLENWLEVKLFQRLNSYLALTDAGEKYLNEMRTALDRIELASIQAYNDSAPTQLTVNAPPTFTLRWLIPRLATFQRNHLDVSVNLTTSLKPVDFPREQYHIAIRGAQQPLPGLRSIDFLTECILPVCHPDVLEKSPLAVPADLAAHTLLTYTTEPYDWQSWFAKADAPDVKPAASLNFEQMYFALQAAKEGLGVVLVPYFLVADEIATGRLCAPLGTLGVQTRNYYAYISPDAIPGHAEDAFCDWLRLEGKSTTKLCDQLMNQDADGRVIR